MSQKDSWINNKGILFIALQSPEKHMQENTAGIVNIDVLLGIKQQWTTYSVFTYNVGL